MGWRKKMLAIFIPLFLLSLFVSLGASYAILSKQMAARTLRDNQNVVLQIQSQMDFAFESIEQFSQMICTDEKINELLLRPAESVRDQTDVRYSVMELLRTYSYLCQWVDTFVIERYDGEVFTSVRGFDEDYRIALQESWYTDYLDAKRNGTVSDKHRFFTAYGSVTVDGISYILRYRNQPSDDMISHLIAEIRWSWFEGMLDSYDNPHGEVCILDRTNRALSGQQPATEAWTQALSADYAEDEGYIFFAAKVAKPEWTLLLTIDKTSLNQEILLELLRYAFIEGVVFLTLITIAVFFIFNKSKYIDTLTQAVHAIAEGRLDTRITLHSGDEMEVLAEHFNDMAYRLERHMEERLRSQEEQHRLQSGLLMAQIRPHFIYNTLNAITFLIEEGRDEDAIANTRALIALLQDTVHFCGDNSFNNLEGEMRILQHYLTIQTVRYPDCIDYETAVADELMPMEVPRMMLQPLVENALLHGIVPAGRRCALRLKARCEGEWLYLCVEDEGVGMTEEQLSTCLENREANGMRGVALSNIIERLRLIFGEGHFSFQIDSRPQEGTRVTIGLPAHGGKEREDGGEHFRAHAG